MGGEQAANVLATVKQGQLAREGVAEMDGPKLKASKLNYIRSRVYTGPYLTLTLIQKAFMDPIREKYETEGSPYHSTARLWDDGIIDPRDTRKILFTCLKASICKEFPNNKYGIFRM